MAVFAILLFGISLIAISSLFVLKHWETGTGRMIAPRFRSKADARARALKQELFNIRGTLGRLGPIAILYARYLIHKGALATAAFARLSERQAHKLADTVSHKRTLIPRETKSQFLKQVSDHKNGGIVS